jgi:GNAT superfamily N-acetyltransferase
VLDLREDVRRYAREGILRLIPVPASLAEQSSAPELYWLIKEIDGIPGGWTFSIFALRTIQYDMATPIMYEPLRDADQVVKAVRYRRSRINVGESPGMAPSVSILLRVFDGIFEARRGMIKEPGKLEKCVGVHAVAVHQEDRSGLIFANSWGIGWGDRGIGRVTKSYLTRYLEDGWLLRVNLAATPIDVQALEQAKDNNDWRSWARHWSQDLEWEDPINVTLGAEKFMVAITTLPSVVKKGYYSVIHLVQAEGSENLIGWAHLYHDENGAGLLEELFVWPTYRRRGAGRILLEQAMRIASENDASLMRILIYEADDVTESGKAWPPFLAANNISWTASRSKPPSVVAIGEILPTFYPGAPSG